MMKILKSWESSSPDFAKNVVKLFQGVSWSDLKDQLFQPTDIVSLRVTHCNLLCTGSGNPNLFNFLRFEVVLYFSKGENAAI